jgi:RNA polymerase sigma-70 factor (ECF subfamily)
MQSESAAIPCRLNDITHPTHRTRMPKPAPQSTPPRTPTPPAPTGAVRPARLDGQEFGERFTGCARLLWTLAAAELGDRSEVEDVLQEAAVIGLQKLDRFEPGTRFEAWMGRIVRFVAANHRRRGVRRRTHPTDPVILDGDVAPDGHARGGGTDPLGPRGELVAGAELFDDELSRALAVLKPTARACLLLRTVLELEYGEIAETLDIPVGTAVSHVHRAREALRRRLEPRGVPQEEQQ